jgi:hypothetical protein
LDCCHAGAGNLRPYGSRGQRNVDFLGAVSGAATTPSKYHKKYDSFIARTAEVMMVPDTDRPDTTEELNHALQSLSLVKGLSSRKALSTASSATFRLIFDQTRREFALAPLQIPADRRSGLHCKIKPFCLQSLQDCQPGHVIVAIVRYLREGGPLDCAERMLICTFVSSAFFSPRRSKLTKSAMSHGTLLLPRSRKHIYVFLGTNCRRTSRVALRATIESGPDSCSSTTRAPSRD